MQSKSKRAVFIRIAAAVLLVVVITTLIYEVTFDVSREITYHTIMPRIKALFGGKLSADGILQLLNSLIPIIGAFVDIVLAFITVIMLFGLKEKTAGVLFIVSAVVDILFFIALNTVYLILIRNSPDISSFISDNIFNAVEFLFVQTLVILLGLLLIGAFKGGSKVVGFILAGLFSAVAVLALIYLIAGIPMGVQSIVGGAGKSTAFIVISGVVNYFINPFVLVLTQIGCILCCLGVALTSKKEKVQEAQDAGQQE